MATPNVSPQLAGEIIRWADLTMPICRSYDAPAKEEERLIYCLLLSTHPDRYTWCTRIHDLVACLRAELQQAQRRPRPAPRITTPIIFPPNQPWPPWQSPAIAQPNCPQASGTGAAQPSSSSHHAPKHKAPPHRVAQPSLRPHRQTAPRSPNTMRYPSCKSHRHCTINRKPHRQSAPHPTDATQHHPFTPQHHMCLLCPRRHHTNHLRLRISPILHHLHARLREIGGKTMHTHKHLRNFSLLKKFAWLPLQAWWKLKPSTHSPRRVAGTPPLPLAHLAYPPPYTHIPRF